VATKPGQRISQSARESLVPSGGSDAGPITCARLLTAEVAATVGDAAALAAVAAVAEWFGTVVVGAAAFAGIANVLRVALPPPSRSAWHPVRWPQWHTARPGCARESICGHSPTTPHP
jgi:hypothetical protein